MKLRIIITLLKIKNKKTKRYQIFNKLYNDYILNNKKKDKTKINYLRNESELYPFSPKLNNRVFITFTPKNTKRNMESVELSYNDFGRTFYNTNRTPFTKKFNYIFNKNNKNGRNRMNDNEYFNDNDRNYYYKNNFSESEKYNDDNDETLYNFYNDKNPINLKMLQVRFQNKRKIMSSRINEKINKQISEYLNDFENIKRKKLLPRNNLNNNYFNFNKDNTKTKIKKSILAFNKDGISSTYKCENLFNKNNKKEIGYKNDTERLSFIRKDKSNSKISIYPNKNKGNKNKLNNKIIYNDSYNYFDNLNKKIINNKENNKEIEINIKGKNTYSNKSLNPSSLGADQTKTFYTNQKINSNNNMKSGNALVSNINSASSKINEPTTHFLTGLKMISGCNECYYDINKDNKNYNKAELSMQSLSDSKMLELASKYITEDDNSSENYYMNNILHNKKKMKNKK